MYVVKGDNGGSPDAGINLMTSNPMGTGSSGGIWFNADDEKYGLGINSKRGDEPTDVLSPQLDGEVRNLYEFVKRGCKDA